ncbi:MAG: hypothetical protein AAGC97_04260 [Planctomycetota bacterium]
MRIFQAMAWLLLTCPILVWGQSTVASSSGSTTRSAAVDASAAIDAAGPTSDAPVEMPFDYSPYRVLIWVASDTPHISADSVREQLVDHLARDFHAVWRTTIRDAPPAVRTAAMRDLSKISFNLIAAADPVLAVKRDHGDVVKMKFANDVSRYVDRIHATQGRINEVRSRIEPVGESTKRFDWISKLVPTDGDALALESMWSQDDIEAVLVSRGMAETLGGQRIGDSKEKVPTAKIIVPPIDGQVSDAMDQYDKIFVVAIQNHGFPGRVQVIELDTLMRNFGSLVDLEITSTDRITDLIGSGLRKAFRPVVRIDNAGTKSASGLIRAGGLILDEGSPGWVQVGDVLEPMIRKNDRNGNPISIGPLDWAYLNTVEQDGSKVEMSFYAGRLGGLQGRSNNRTFRVGLKVQPQLDESMIRLHAQKDTNQPLIGYEIYDKELDSTAMTFVGRTDWNGRLIVEPIDRPLRLLYVKNGGAVLARLPIVPGHLDMAVADLAGDDMRLQAEAYIRGVQNSIIDLVALRELFKARIMLRLKRGSSGDLESAEELLEALRRQPSNEMIANDMGKRSTIFLKAIGRNANQRKKVDNMFSKTREMLTKHINPKLVNDLEAAFIQAKENGGKLPPGDDDG